MKRYFLLLAMAVLTLVSASAESAKAVLDRTASVLSSYASCTANFTATMGRGSTQGSIILQDRKFFVNGNEALVWFDGKTQWMLIKNTNEVNISTPSAQELQRMNPYFFLNLYKSGYDLSLKDGGAYHIVTLTAKTTQAINKMEVTINKSTSLPAKVVMTSKRGATNTITISNLKKGKKLPDSTFRFNAKDYPKANIVDLR